ncbi:MAG: phage holin family protein [Patescibacteria group bacterium]
MYILLRWLLNAAALMAVAYLVPGFHVQTFYTALIVALVLGIVNAVIKPILVILTLPISILTLGLFTFVINASLLLLVSTVVKGFEVESFTAALLGGLVLWVISWFTSAVTKR